MIERRTGERDNPAVFQLASRCASTNSDLLIDAVGYYCRAGLLSSCRPAECLGSLLRCPLRDVCLVKMQKTPSIAPGHGRPSRHRGAHCSPLAARRCSVLPSCAKTEDLCLNFLFLHIKSSFNSSLPGWNTSIRIQNEERGRESQ